MDTNRGTGERTRGRNATAATNTLVLNVKSERPVKRETVYKKRTYKRVSPNRVPAERRVQRPIRFLQIFFLAFRGRTFRQFPTTKRVVAPPSIIPPYHPLRRADLSTIRRDR